MDRGVSEEESDQRFKEEEELRLALEERGRIHDCILIGCTIAPDGVPIAEGGKPGRKPPLNGRIRYLLKKLRGIDVKGPRP